MRSSMPDCHNEELRNTEVNSLVESAETYEDVFGEFEVDNEESED